MADTGVQRSGSPTDELKAAVRRLLVSALDRAFGIALEKVESFAGTLDDIAARGGVKLGGLIGAARAAVGGANPVWGAVKGAFAALSPAARVAVVLVLGLAVLLLPLTVVLVLLFVIAMAIVAAVRSGGSTRR